MRRLFRQFSFPGGIPSHVAPETPGSIHEGGELGYVLSHAYGAAMDNPDLLVAAVVGDGEFETGPLAASWHANKFVDPVHDGAVLPILHLNGYKIANPTVPARIPRDELESLLRGYGHEVFTSRATTRWTCTRRWSRRWTRRTTGSGRSSGGPRGRRPRSPTLADDPAGHAEGLDRPGRSSTASGRGHLARPPGARSPQPGRTTSTAAMLEEWMRSYRPEELFDADGALVRSCVRSRPGTRRMSANPHANGGLLRRPLDLPSFRDRRGGGERPGAIDPRADPRARSVAGRRRTRNPDNSGSSARTRRPRTGSTRSTK